MSNFGWLRNLTNRLRSNNVRAEVAKKVIPRVSGCPVSKRVVKNNLRLLEYNGAFDSWDFEKPDFPTGTKPSDNLTTAGEGREVESTSNEGRSDFQPMNPVEAAILKSRDIQPEEGAVAGQKEKAPEHRGDSALKVNLGPLPFDDDPMVLRRLFEEAVGLLRLSREEKELELMAPAHKRDLQLLNGLDEKEREACGRLYGIFKYNLGITDTVVDDVPSKKDADTAMESYFGSLNTGDSDFKSAEDLEDAASVFSCYLSRKVWVPLPWRKFGEAVGDFYERVAVPIDQDQSQKATEIAISILRAITEGGRLSPSDEDMRDPVPDSSCFEAKKSEGGKREALYCSNEPPVGFVGVTATPIYTGGKIRVITVSTCETSKYLWINKFLGRCFRQLPCSIFGGDVQEWWDKCGESLLRGDEPDLEFISGDLEAATDLFDGRITDAVLEELVKLYPELLDQEDLNNMRSFTTNAKILPGRPGNTSLKKLLELAIDQCRGQLMGSEISFPILCILSLTAYLFTKTDKWLNSFNFFARNKPVKALKMLKRVKRCGVNGDDLVFRGTPAELEKWLEGVKAIGGRVSRGKTLRNTYFFTVNSELWSKKGKVFCARPSFLTALSDGRKYFISPAREWDEYRRCPLIVNPSIFNIEYRLKLDIPVAWGGLGLVKRFDPYRAALHKGLAALRRKWARQGQWRGTDEAIQDSLEKREKLEKMGPKVECIISKEMHKAFSRVYNTQLPLWSVPVREKPEEILEVLKESRWRCQIPNYKDLLYNEYNKLMCPSDQKLARIPIRLLKAYNAQPLDDSIRPELWGIDHTKKESVLPSTPFVPASIEEMEAAIRVAKAVYRCEHHNLRRSGT